MDRIMTNDKIAHADAANDLPAPDVHGRDKGVKLKKPGEDKVESLSIDDSDDFGGDPYNHTGSFCVPKFDD